MDNLGHLECPFHCGRNLDSLEALAFHIEVDHREDDDMSPFVVRKSPPRERSVTEYYTPSPLRTPPPIPQEHSSKILTFWLRSCFTI
jgi:hypothetical protein